MKLIDNFLNSITMYRLILYVLTAFFTAALVFSFFGLLSFAPLNLFFSAGLLIFVCWISNKILASIFNATLNLESTYISAFILALILTPATNINQFILLGLAGFLSQASKYFLAINKKHLFNPVAFSIVFLSLIFNSPASWWIGTVYMLPLVVIGGLLIARKIKRFSLILSFFAILILTFFISGNLTPAILLETPILFFAYIMLIEPQTTPSTKKLQMIYGGLVGLLSFYLTSELALLVGNIFAYLVSPKEKLILKLKEKMQIAADAYEFIFEQSEKRASLIFKPGQYMEWTLGQENPDTRGNRRYFTIASSPEEDNLRIGVKFYPNGSSFKKTLINMKSGDQIVASQLAGEFTLPKDQTKKLSFIAGGIGVTSYRSMIKFLLDINQKRDIILLYSNKSNADIVYKDIFDEAYKKLDIETVYVNTDTSGYIDERMIIEKVPDFKDRTFYISGPHSMTDAFQETLKKMGVKDIKVDFFPGYA